MRHSNTTEYSVGNSRKREAVSALLWRLRLYRITGWWDAGTDARRVTR